MEKEEKEQHERVEINCMLLRL